MEKDVEPVQQFGPSTGPIPAPGQVNSPSAGPVQPPNVRRDRADSEPKVRLPASINDLIFFFLFLFALD